MAGISVGELFVDLFFRSDQVRLKDFIASVDELNMASMASSLGLGALYTGLEKVLSASADTAIEVNKFNAVTGISGEKMQAFDNAAKRAGLGAGTLTQAVVSLQEKITDMKLTGTGASFLSSFLGINPYEDVDAITTLEKIIERIKQQVKPEMRGWAMQQVGLSPELLAVDFSKIKEDVVQSASQTKQMMQYFGEIQDIGNEIKKTWFDIANSIAPTLIGFLSVIREDLEFINWLSGKIAKSFIGKGLSMAGNVGTNTLDWWTTAAAKGYNAIQGGQTYNNTFHISSDNPKAQTKEEWEDFYRHQYDVADRQSQVRK